MVANAYMNIGVIYMAQGIYEEALVEHQKALEVLLAVHGQEHLHVAAQYGNMGNVYSGQGQYERALEYHQKSLDMIIRVVGHDQKCGHVVRQHGLFV